MRLTPILSLAGCALAACSSQPSSNAPIPANASIEPDSNSAATSTANVQAPLNPPAPGEPGGLANDMTPVSEAPFTEESAQGAGNVVQTYYALIEARKYRQAWALWGNEGKASGMSPQAFAASFGRYSEYHANIGAPGAVEAGAGQRYVTVPVQAYGRMKDGQPFNQLGSVTLHRAGDIDGATAEQKKWGIRSADLVARPVPGASPTPEATEDNRSVARYRCMDGTKLTARFDPDNGEVALEHGNAPSRMLKRQGTSTGIRYAGGGYSFGGKGDMMTFTAPNAPTIACTVIR
ncbi:MliC family protein [Sphingomonas sp. JC676]|uniref:MliC family protein n=1 Tax=Sphingomonas sp. JC676 TaxID=2768065 RepID=UPI00223AC856|nr:MliC family protein [Sphingomonas sp. JC676]